MVTAIITHEVKDFASWKKDFDQDEPRRNGAGIKLQGVYRDVEKPNLVSIIMDVPSIDIVKGMLNSPDLQAFMKEAGVIGAPEAKILQKA